MAECFISPMYDYDAGDDVVVAGQFQVVYQDEAR